MAREITGRHVAAVTVGFFTVIIAVNAFMATKAIGTFPGVEAKNTYYASQNFDAARKAQQALGWAVRDSYRDGMLTITVTDTSDAPARIRDFQVLVGRATESAEDQTPVFVREAGAFVAPLVLRPGKWILRIEALAEDGTRFRQQRQIHVNG